MLNKVMLIGRLGKDPEIRNFSDNNSIANFTLATNESYKDKDGTWKDLTEWHNIKLPNKFMADRAEKNLKKGSQIYVEGKIKTRSYDDKDGNKKYVTEIVADSFKMLDKADGQRDTSKDFKTKEYAKPEEDNFNANTADDDLPF